jgi:transposase
MGVSPATLLRLIRRTALPNRPTPRLLGIDDWVLRKGHRYGTILVDLERHAAIDLLPDREMEIVAQWLREHPGVELVMRDRSNA